MTESPGRHDAAALRRATDTMVGSGDRVAREFWAGTRDRDVSRNRAALVDAITGDPPYSILDFDCGPTGDSIVSSI